MSALTLKRLNKELERIKKSPITGIIINEPEDIMRWNATIIGPPDSPYENGLFHMLIRYDEDYPVKAPSIKFLTPMYHPNIYRDGKICIDILQSEWSPSQNIGSILLSIMSLLTDPNPSSPANREAAELYSKDKTVYEKKVREHIEENKDKLL
jgi:ubiquitin-conjugating enzyme E2 A